jgi:DeoR/GlpR family transcriptional regulator of sugar metabolism
MADSEGNPMVMAERRDRIVEFINREGTVTFSQLKCEFPEVSEMTLRTDLKTLDQQRLIIRVHGGAVFKSTLVERAHKCIVLMDSSKEGRPSTFRVCGLPNVNTVVSDGDLSGDFITACEDAGVTLL